MKRTVKPLVLVLTCLIMLSLSVVASAQTMPAGQGATLPNGLVVDAWMLQSDGQTVADCLGQTFSQYGNKKMQEMINLVWVDPDATSSANAVARLTEALAGANPAIGTSAMHTGGYESYLLQAPFSYNFPSSRATWVLLLIKAGTTPISTTLVHLVPFTTMVLGTSL